MRTRKRELCNLREGCSGTTVAFGDEGRVLGASLPTTMRPAGSVAGDEQAL